jgi:hypothetical protein
MRVVLALFLLPEQVEASTRWKLRAREVVSVTKYHRPKIKRRIRINNNNNNNNKKGGGWGGKRDR